MHEYFTTLNDMEADIMLLPRNDSYFNRCKSNLKFLEAAMLEIPCVAQSFSAKDSPYDKDINGENGLLAENEDEFRKQTELLIRDKSLRRTVGKKAKEYVVENYRIEKHVDKWIDLFNQLYKERWMNQKLFE